MLAVSGDTAALSARRGGHLRVTAFLHARARKIVWVAVFGVLTGLSALGALSLGAALAG